MRSRILTAVLAVVAAPLVAQDRDPDMAVEGAGSLPPGWMARTDRGRSMDNVNFRTMGQGLHITLGPAAILYRETDRAADDFTISATYSRTRAPRHPEAYGIFMGGNDLEGEGQSYVYFLVRGSGEFLVKRRTGSSTANISAGWTGSSAAHSADERGRVTDKLTIRVEGNRVMFLVNDTEVYSGSTSDIPTDGTYGLRVNHNLDLHIADFGVTH